LVIHDNNNKPRCDCESWYRIKEDYIIISSRKMFLTFPNIEKPVPALNFVILETAWLVVSPPHWHTV